MFWPPLSPAYTDGSRVQLCDRLASGSFLIVREKRTGAVVQSTCEELCELICSWKYKMFFYSVTRKVIVLDSLLLVRTSLSFDNRLLIETQSLLKSLLSFQPFSMRLC